LLSLTVIQAAEGDSFLLDAISSNATTRLLIDGGPRSAFRQNLSKELERVRDISRVVVTHVDNDHVVGVLELFRSLKETGLPFLKLNGLWFNSFARIVGQEPSEVLRQVASLPFTEDDVLAPVIQGIKEGEELSELAKQLEISVNSDFDGGLICFDAPPQPVPLGSLTVTTLGPTESDLERLRRKWELNEGLALEEIRRDSSVFNRSSIIFVAEADGRKVMLTGDGVCDATVVERLASSGLTDTNGRFPLDVLKLAHHGSAYNTFMEFLRAVPAETYVISANGRYGNPDRSILELIVDQAHNDGRKIQLVVTNETDSTKELSDTRPEGKYPYKMRTMDKSTPSLRLELS
jgi:beta-lactamase superfamily II metal-dependent hydrolase